MEAETPVTLASLGDFNIPGPIEITHIAAPSEVVTVPVTAPENEIATSVVSTPSEGFESFGYLPENFQPRSLVGLHLTYSPLVEICKEPKLFRKFTANTQLFRDPGPHLQRIILKGCVSLIAVHPSLGNLKNLIFLSMENCKNLKCLPNSIQMESLESLNLSGCEKLENFPEIRGNMEFLSELILSRTAIQELPSSVGWLIGISLLDLSSCDLGQLEEVNASNTAIWQLPDSFGNLSKLRVLSLKRGWKELKICGCNLSGKEINALTCSTSLLELNLSRNKFIFLPDSISQLSQLQYLNLTYCLALIELPKLPPSIEELYAEDFLAPQAILALPMYPRLYQL
uniref:TMV resistance protein N-like n=1 Tax=Nicotiana sylvestris TaxID=4096 RepID=A0A1U7W6I4_NICSY|nr:PREDICTED: TMV resistance protein N-like [Nicotiana sylvestris]